MSCDKADRLPPPVIHRLPHYLAHVERLREDGVTWVSSREIAKALGLTSSTVRQDLSHLAFSGIAHRGYQTDQLESALSRTLGVDRRVNIVIVGAGNLGRALTLHEEFGRHGLVVCGLFDANPRVVGEPIGGLRVLPVSELARVVHDSRVAVGMIAVPANSAQTVADALVHAGVRGILNLTPAHVRVPESVASKDARILAILQELVCLMETAVDPGASFSPPRSTPTNMG